jgi:hypothetical protein
MARPVGGAHGLRAAHPPVGKRWRRSGTVRRSGQVDQKRSLSEGSASTIESSTIRPSRIRAS